MALDHSNPELHTRFRLGGTLSSAVFITVHLVCFAAIWTGVYWRDIAICVGLYWLRMFAITAGYHRYFSHRTYKMGRVMQFIMAFLAQSSAQKGVLWWAANHRHHHRHSDQPEDCHSPVQRGFWWSHVGWIMSSDHTETRADDIKDFSQYPELVWLNKYHVLPVVVLAAIVYLAAGWSGLVVGFFWSTVITWHGTFTINSLTHVFGKRRYETTDDSRNNWLLALITMGEGWHNNHHHYQASCRQGFFWWEIDATYYILKGLEKLRLVRDLREPPRHLVEGKAHPRRAAVLAAKANRQTSARPTAARVDDSEPQLAPLAPLANLKVD
ncbi:MAG: acyl-CoA desaturase [Myxococcales bacterium]|nr:acyl-CoA desaturase [Myxococcales bacterium]